MKRLWRLLLVSLLGTLVAVPARALDLLESVALALAADAEYLAAEARARGGREQVPLARAQLLPSIAINATRMQNDLTSTTRSLFGQDVTSHSSYTSQNYALTLRQPLYRPGPYAALKQAEARVTGVEAALARARQGLALRVITAYANVLLAEESLRQTEVERSATETQLAAARKALALGQGTRTDVDDLAARLDLVRARQLVARQQLAQARHELVLLIQRPVEAVRFLDPQRLELLPPQPAQLDAWIAQAEANSPEIKELAARREAARHEIERAYAGHKPTVDMIAQRVLTASDNVTNPNSRYNNTQFGVQLTIPLFAGGYVVAEVRQAQAGLEEADFLYQAALRRLAAQTRKEFQSVVEGVEKVRALEKALASADQAVYSNEKGYQAGTRSRLDILDAERLRSQVRLELAKERINYLLAYARLLSLSGSIDEAAIERMNRWLSD